MKKQKTSPFLRTHISTRSIMIDVLIALLPVSIMAVVNFGIKSLIMIVLGISSAVIFEYLYQKIMDKNIRISDFSAAVTGLLVALSYPVTAPLWIIVFGSFIAIVIIKQMSGGIGKNHLNPAVFSRVLVKILFTPIITKWVMPGPDMISTTTPLEFIGNGQTVIAQGAPQIEALFFGYIGGGIGETVKWAIILGALYLVFRKVISAKIPLMTLAGLFFITLLFGKSNLEFASYHVLSGTVMFAAVFMVTDYTSGPLNHRARVYYGFSIGILTGIIRYLFALPGGIGVAILIMNILSPIYDAWFTPRVFGHKGKRVVIETR